jgi:hypothetical protein
MPKLKYISSPTEIPAGQNYVLVEYGEQLCWRLIARACEWNELPDRVRVAANQHA